jgi:hypothetical protein
MGGYKYPSFSLLLSSLDTLYRTLALYSLHSLPPSLSTFDRSERSLYSHYTHFCHNYQHSIASTLAFLTPGPAHCTVFPISRSSLPVNSVSVCQTEALFFRCRLCNPHLHSLGYARRYTGVSVKIVGVIRDIKKPYDVLIRFANIYLLF